MGTVLSISPASRKGAILDAEAAAAGPGVKNEKKSVIVSALTFKRLVTSSAKKKSSKKINPNPPPDPPPPTHGQVARLNRENTNRSLLQNGDEKKPKAPIPVPVPTVPTQSNQPVKTEIVLSQNGKLSSIEKQPSSLTLVSPRRVIIQASTGELLRCLGDFLCKRCPKLKLTSGEVILWFRNIDRTLLIQGWQDQGFITPANLVFVYLLCDDTVVEDSIDSSSELHGTFLSCLYMAYSYMGSEISYPLKPFMVEANKDVFWERSLSIINRMSAKMLLLNSDPHFFTEVFQELKNQGDSSDSVVDR